MNESEEEEEEEEEDGDGDEEGENEEEEEEDVEAGSEKEEEVQLTALEEQRMEGKVLGRAAVPRGQEPGAAGVGGDLHPQASTCVLRSPG